MLLRSRLKLFTWNQFKMKVASKITKTMRNFDTNLLKKNKREYFSNINVENLHDNEKFERKKGTFF